MCYNLICLRDGTQVLLIPSPQELLQIQESPTQEGRKKGWTVAEMLDEACDLDEKNCRGTRSKDNDDLYQVRSAAILEAGTSSRWTSEEVDKMKMSTSDCEAVGSLSPPVSANFSPVSPNPNPEPDDSLETRESVASANHGWDKDGDVLLTRVTQGSRWSSAPTNSD